MNPDPSGLVYMSSFITPAEERALITEIMKQPWTYVGSGFNSRQVQQYGKTYDYASRSLRDAPPIPIYLVDLTRRVSDVWKTGEVPDQIIINKYEPGQGINAHTDHVRLFGGSISSLSLNGQASMWFRERGGKCHETVMERCSLVTLQGDARYKWTHEIKGSSKSDRRISITFRKCRG